MPVVINQFEVVPAPEPGQGQPAGSGSAAAGTPASQPSQGRISTHDLERLMRRLAERQARIRAH